MEIIKTWMGCKLSDTQYLPGTKTFMDKIFFKIYETSDGKYFISTEKSHRDNMNEIFTRISKKSFDEYILNYKKEA